MCIYIYTCIHTYIYTHVRYKVVSRFFSKPAVCTHTHTHAHTHTHTFIYHIRWCRSSPRSLQSSLAGLTTSVICACVHACMRACVHVCMRACMHACMCACMSACVHACVRTCALLGQYVCPGLRKAILRSWEPCSFNVLYLFQFF